MPRIPISTRISSHLIPHARSDDGSRGGDGGDDRTRRSSSSLIRFPYHGSCPKCHHLHTNKQLRLSLDLLKHVRVRCDVCDHQMFGIGRTSTQTTLASVESVLSPSHSNRNSLISRSSLQQVCVAGPAEDVQGSHLARPENLAPQPTLSTIDEAHTSAARSRSNSNTRAPNEASARPEETAVGASVERDSNRIGPQSLQQRPTELPRSSWGQRLPLSRWRGRVSRAFHGKSDGGGRLKEWEFFGPAATQVLG
jgi:hypothetical protein